MLTQIKQEIEAYKTESVEVTEGHTVSTFKTIRRIMLFKTQTYPTGKFDSQGNYKFWFDVISPRSSSEIKNIDFDTKDILIASDVDGDAGKVLIANARLRTFLKETGQAAKLNEAIERGSEWGNVVWKKIKGGYKLMDLTKVYVLNQLAETLEDSDVIEHEIMYPSDLRKMIGTWDNVKELLDSASEDEKKGAPEFYVYERNGEINEKKYNEVKKIDKPGDETKYVLAKVIVGGRKKDSPEQILFCDKISAKPYKEYHRGTYAGTWLRLGLYQILFDIQTRANEIGNQIARGLEYSGKTIFRSKDRTVAQNILTDLQNGDIVKSEDLQQVATEMRGLDQLLADWNRLMILADKLANSFEVVTGEALPSGTPFKLGDMLNMNANKLFDFIREKLSIAFQDVIQDWILPDLLKDLKAMTVLKLSNDSGFLERYYEMVIDDWYIRNLISLPPHSPEEAMALKEQKIQELIKNKEVAIKLQKDMWESFEPRAIVIITGENFNLGAELETLKNFIALEQDPIRRTALIEMAMRKKNIDVSKLPKSSPEMLMPQPAEERT